MILRYEINLISKLNTLRILKSHFLELNKYYQVRRTVIQVFR